MKAGVAILISDKTDFKTKTVIRDKEGSRIQSKKKTITIIKTITITNIYAPNIRAPQLCKANTNKGKNRQEHNNSGGL